MKKGLILLLVLMVGIMSCDPDGNGNNNGNEKEIAVEYRGEYQYFYEHSEGVTLYSNSWLTLSKNEIIYNIIWYPDSTLPTSFSKIEDKQLSTLATTTTTKIFTDGNMLFQIKGNENVLVGEFVDNNLILNKLEFNDEYSPSGNFLKLNGDEYDETGILLVYVLIEGNYNLIPEVIILDTYYDNNTFGFSTHLIGLPLLHNDFFIKIDKGIMKIFNQNDTPFFELKYRLNFLSYPFNRELEITEATWLADTDVPPGLNSFIHKW